MNIIHQIPLPTQEVWSVATLERNWLLFKVGEPDPITFKRPKHPTGINGDLISAEDAAVWTYHEVLAHQERFGPNFMVGYLPRPGSALVLADLDNCVTLGAVIDPWAQQIIDLDGTYAEISTSGTGIRIVMAREAGDDQYTSGEANGAGFFANGGRGAVLTWKALPERSVERITPSTSLKRAVLDRKGHSDHTGSSSINVDTTLDEVTTVLAHIPNDGRWRYDDWIKVGYLIKSVADDDDGKALFTSWSEQFPEKQTERVDRMWQRGLKRPKGTVTIGTLILMARTAHDGQTPPAVDALVRDRAFRAAVAMMPDVADLPPLHANLTLPLPTTPVTATPTPPTFDLWPASSLYGQAVPPRVWHVTDMIPDATVTLLGGDGGTGKSLLALQLAASTALGHKWVGVETRQSVALYLSAEDDKAELHRRLADIARAEDVALSDLSGLHVASLAGQEALLATAQPNGVMIATVLLELVRERVAALRPKLVVLDTLADLFGGNENDRSQARQFISMLRGVAIDYQCAVVVLSHPSLSGMAQGTGSSGSTGWNNSVRSRLYLKRDASDTHDLDPDARILQVMKSNYGRIGDEIRLRWQRGVFVAGGYAEYGGVEAANTRADNTFLTLLDEFTRQNRIVSALTGGNYAPKIFVDSPNNNGITKKGFAAAMERLLAATQIEQVSYGPPSKQRNKLQRVKNVPSIPLPT